MSMNTSRAERWVRMHLTKFAGNRDQIALAVGPTMLHVCLTALRAKENGTIDPDEEQLYNETMPDISAACLEPFAKVPRKRERELIDVVLNTARWILDPFDHISLFLVTQGVLYWIDRRTNDGSLVVGDISRFRQASDRVTEHLLKEEGGKAVDRFEYGADGIADQIEDRLAALGFIYHPAAEAEAA